MKNYFFKGPIGPTEINLSQAFDSLGWSNNAKQSGFSHKNLIDDKLLEVFEHKHKLHYWLTKHCSSLEPQTFVLDELFLEQTLNKLSNDTSVSQHPWILKPALLNNGDGINIFKDLLGVKEYFKQSNRYSGLFILQKYINNPLLINNKKFSIRVFVILSANKGLTIYPEGYLNICQKDYMDTSFELDSHLTNEHLNKDGSTNNKQLLTSSWQEFDNILPAIKDQCQRIFLPWLKKNILESNSYAILGVDFMNDNKNKLYLLEINHGACFPVNNQHPLYETLYKPLWHYFVTKII